MCIIYIPLFSFLIEKVDFFELKILLIFIKFIYLQHQ